jgi:uridine kinase
MKHKPYLVGIIGGSASGKTYLLHQLQKAFPPDVITFIEQDNYYKPIDKIPCDAENNPVFDDPQAIDLALFHHHLCLLLSGESVSIRKYHYNNPDLPRPLLTYHPTPILVVEGLFIFHQQATSRLFDLKIFVDADEHIKLTRRLIRDTLVRGYSMESILQQYRNHVIPMYRKYVEPHKYECDLILQNNVSLEKGAQVLVNHLKVVLHELGVEAQGVK